MSNLTTFRYNDSDIRTVTVSGEPWWVLKDVCDVLGLSTPARVAERLCEDEVSSTHITDRIGRQQETTIISESGLYSVIIRSDKPEAVPFRRWVTHEVLPSIRKHGAYMTPETLEKAILNPDTVITLATALKEEQAQRQLLEKTVRELMPRAHYTDIILDNKGLVTITQIAKDYGMSGAAMNRLLHSLGVQYKQSGQWLLYHQLHGQGYTHSKTINITRSDGRPDVVMETHWTQTGRMFIYTLLKKHGILPVIERDLIPA